MRLDQLSDVGLEQLVRHPETAARIQHLLGEKEAVGAIEIAFVGDVEGDRIGRDDLGAQNVAAPGVAEVELEIFGNEGSLADESAKEVALGGHAAIERAKGDEVGVGLRSVHRQGLIVRSTVGS